MTSKPLAPDPTADTPPPDFPKPEYWPAYQVWAQGGTRRDAGLTIGISPDTVGHWAKRWRTHYNTQHLTIRGPGLTDPTIRAHGTAASSAARALRWIDRRATHADKLADTAEELQTSLTTLLRHYLDPDRIHLLEPAVAVRAIDALTRSLERVYSDADRLSTPLGQGPAGALPAGGTDPNEGEDAGLLAALLAGSTEETPQAVIDDVETIAKGFLTLIEGGGDEPEPIETTGRKKEATG